MNLVEKEKEEMQSSYSFLLNKFQLFDLLLIINGNDFALPSSSIGSMNIRFPILWWRSQNNEINLNLLDENSLKREEFT